MWTPANFRWCHLLIDDARFIFIRINFHIDLDTKYRHDHYPPDDTVHV